MSTCDCFIGASADVRYKPKGSFETNSGLNVYIAQTAAHSDLQMAENIVFCPDGFGLAMHNIQLADMYAAQGYTTVIVDYFEGDALPDCFMKYTPGTDLEAYVNLTEKEKEIIRQIDMPTWQKRHNPARIASLLVEFFLKYQEYISGALHIVGHCFGGKAAFRLAQSEDLASVVIFHPSFLDPSDLENVKSPVFLGCAETDVFTPSLSNDMISLLPKAGCSYKLVVYGGTRHGFSSRADPNDPEAVKTFQEAFDDGLTWLRMHRPR